MMQTHPSAMLLAAQLLHVARLALPRAVGRGPARPRRHRDGRGRRGGLAVRRTPGVSRVVLFLGAPAVVFTLLEAVQPDTDGSC